MPLNSSECSLTVLRVASECSVRLRNCGRSGRRDAGRTDGNPHHLKPHKRVAIDIKPEVGMQELVNGHRTQHIAGYHAEEDEHAPEKHLVVNRMLVPKPIAEHIARKGDDVSVRLGAVAEENDITHEDTEGMSTELEVAPPVAAPEEENHQNKQYTKLEETVVGKEELLETGGKEQTDEVCRAVVGLYHREPALIERYQSVEAHLESRHQEEQQAAEHSIAHVTPETGIAQQQTQLDAAVNLSAGGIHDEQHRPEELPALHESEGEEEDVAHHSVVLETEDALLQNQQQEEEYLQAMVEIVLGQRPDGKEEERVVGKIPDKRTQPPRGICHGSKEEIEVGSIEEIYLVLNHPLGSIYADAVEEIDGGIAVVVEVGAASAEGFKRCGSNGNEHAEDEDISRIGEKRGEGVDDFFHA